MREYTVLLDPPVYTPGEQARSAAPVAAATTAPPVRRAAPGTPPAETAAPTSSASAPSTGASAAAGNGIRVGQGDTLTKIAREVVAQSTGSTTQANVDQAMIALYRSNPDAFGGNINVLRQGAILRVPNADQIAALNQKQAMGEVHRQMDAWRGSEAAGAPAAGHLRLVTPSAGGSATGAGAASTESNSAETQALKDRVNDLRVQAGRGSIGCIEIRNNELNALQQKLGNAKHAGTPGRRPPRSSSRRPPCRTAGTGGRRAAGRHPGTGYSGDTPPAEPPVTAVPPPSETSSPTPPVVPPATPPVKKPAAVAAGGFRVMDRLDRRQLVVAGWP